MKKVLLVEPLLKPLGGGIGVAVWIIQVLQENSDLCLLTWELPNIELINQYYGTSLEKSKFKVYSVSPFLRFLINFIPDSSNFQIFCLLMRIAKKMQWDYDVVITARDEADLGEKGIQYINYPYSYHLYQKFEVSAKQSWYHRLWYVLNFYYRPWRLISDYSFERMKNNLTLVNSDWTGKITKKLYGIETKTVYPPVPGIFKEVPWMERENGFVCIGRFVPEKRLEMIVEILAKVRAQGYDLHLHIIGSYDTRWGHEYYYQVKKLVEQNSSWIFLNENLSRQNLLNLVSQHKYGIHAMVDEHFGIAVAEMVKSGCITFVPNDGGQVEIVGKDDRLLYSTVEEAVIKILRILSDPKEQIILAEYLKSRGELFSSDRFSKNIKEIVEQFCQDK